MEVIFDIETNGLLDTLNTIHCIAFQDISTPGSPIISCNDHGGQYSIRDGLKVLQSADCVIGHNIAAFDIPALAKVYPGFKVEDFRDTLLLSTLTHPDLEGEDYARGWRNTPRARLIGRHALEAWGVRLGCWKGDYAEQCKAQGIDPWREWNQDMDDYCRQDVNVTARLYAHLRKARIAPEALRLEHAIAPILARQQRHGFLFDAKAARTLEQTLAARRAEVGAELASAIPPWERVKRTFVPKRDNKKLGYVKGEEITVYEDVTFNPASRDHIADRLKTLYGWTPTEFTDKGKPKVDEEVLSGLKYPIIPALLDYLTVDKRLGQLAEGREAWVKAVAADGRIHGNVHQNATVTGRMTHSRPNMTQVPRTSSPYGRECRALFTVPAGKALVGVDASGLELRCLAHYLARYDNGDYARVILEGDVHSVNQKAAGIATRDDAKTFIYAFLYGAGDEKLGSIIGKGRKAGKALRAKFLSGIPAFGRLIAGIQNTLQARKTTKDGMWLRGLDGRRLHIRSEHAALNTLLQSAGALVMKQALVLADASLQSEYGTPGVEYEFVANVHDEFQIEANADTAEFVGGICVQAIRDAGDYFGFRCPLDGEYKIGRNWAETH